MCAGLVVIVSLRTALGSLKEERRKMKTNNLRGRRFRFITLETSVSHAKGISSEKSPDHFGSRNAETTKIHSASLAMLATLMDSSEALTPKKKAGIVRVTEPTMRDLLNEVSESLRQVGSNRNPTQYSRIIT